MARRTGRPTAYRKKYDKLALNYCLLGATDKELADFFEVSERTINAWKAAQPTFLQSIKRGKAQADAEVASRLYERACGTPRDPREGPMPGRGGRYGFGCWPDQALKTRRGRLVSSSAGGRR